MIDLLADHDIAVMEIDGFPHPLSAVYRRSTLPHVENLLAQNRLRPVFLFDRFEPGKCSRRRCSLPIRSCSRCAISTPATIIWML